MFYSLITIKSGDVKMINRLSIILLLGLSLAACSGSETKEETSDAEVVDNSTTVDSGDTGATATGIGDEGAASVNPLDDPQSPLYIRVIYFEYDSSEIRGEYRAAVEAHANYLANNPNTIINLEGHADERGSREYNLALGEKRAQAVKRQMVLLGASAGQIRVVSYGEERPVIDGHDESSWAQNRRVEIIY